MAVKFFARVGSFESVAWCSVGSTLIGFFLMIAGAIITGIAYTELTPPDWDQNYNRYKGSDLKRILGPMLLASGGLVLFGSCGFFIYAFLVDTEDDYSPPGTPNLTHKYTSPSVAAVNMYEDDLDLEKN